MSLALYDSAPDPSVSLLRTTLASQLAGKDLLLPLFDLFSSLCTDLPLELDGWWVYRWFTL